MASSLFQSSKTTNQSQQTIYNTLNTVKQITEGKDPQQVFYEECQKRGVKPNSILGIVNLFSKILQNQYK